MRFRYLNCSSGNDKFRNLRLLFRKRKRNKFFPRIRFPIYRHSANFAIFPPTVVRRRLSNGFSRLFSARRITKSSDCPSPRPVHSHRWFSTRWTAFEFTVRTLLTLIVSSGNKNGNPANILQK